LARASWQEIWRLLVALVALVAIAVTLGGCTAGGAAAPTTKLNGTMLNGKQAPDFTLLDHTGAEVRLSAFRGKPVVLTFLYTSCPDTCPVVTAKFTELTSILGERAAEVVMLAVTVDPERDAPGQVDDFLSKRNLNGVMAFLTGKRDALEAVWKAYHVGVSILPIKAGSPESRLYGAYAIGHSDAVYVLDKVGRQRVFLRSTFEVREMLENLEVLLRE
jgi:protein SCO1/2